MDTHRRLCWNCLCLSLLALWPSTVEPGRCCADIIKLKTGGELRGKLVDSTTSGSSEQAIRTVNGSLIVVRSNSVKFVALRSLLNEEYEQKARLAPPTVAAQWELAEWCVENRLLAQREQHLQKIISLEPDNAAAHQALGHQLRNGEWTTYDEHMLALGYVRYKGKYITPEEKQLQENSQQQRQQQLAWYDKIRVWSNWLTGRFPAQQQKAIDALKEINDPAAIPALENFLSDSETREVRQLYLETLGQIPDPATLSALLDVALWDEDTGLRRQALVQIPLALHGKAVAELIPYLKHADNRIVRRSATALKTIGSEQAVPFLIEALVTSHKYRIPVEVPAVGVTLNPAGGITPGLYPPALPPDIQAGLLTGLYDPTAVLPPPQSSGVNRMTTVRIDQPNPEVLEALKELTSADFGFDQRTWRLWWMSQNT